MQGNRFQPLRSVLIKSALFLFVLAGWCRSLMPPILQVTNGKLEGASNSYSSSERGDLVITIRPAFKGKIIPVVSIGSSTFYLDEMEVGSGGSTSSLSVTLNEGGYSGYSNRGRTVAGDSSSRNCC